jgi:hypothetical protein
LRLHRKRHLAGRTPALPAKPIVGAARRTDAIDEAVGL